MKRVQQEHSMGCGVACVAMVADRSYAEVAALVPNHVNRGFGYHVLFGLLNAFGLHYQMVFSTDTLTNTPRSVWPPEPFAPAHIVCGESTVGGHYVVWRWDGSVIDPAPGRSGFYELADYGRLMHVIALWPAEGEVL